MSFQLSPGVNVREIDLTTVIPAVATTDAGIGGVFRWGPVEKTLLVSNEDELVARFGRPTNLNAETFFSAASFLAYGNRLHVSRAFEANASFNSIAASGIVSSVEAQQSIVKNEEDYETKLSFPSGVEWVAKYPGEIGNSLEISVCDSANAFAENINLVEYAANTIDETITFTVGSNSAVVSISSDDGDANVSVEALEDLADKLQIGDVLVAGNSTIGQQFMEITAISSPAAIGGSATGETLLTISFKDIFKLQSNVVATAVERRWKHFGLVDLAPGQSEFQAAQGNTAAQDELHVVVSDKNGKVTGVPGTVLEVFQALSRATDAKTVDGASNYYKDVINTSSRFVWFANDRAGAESAPAAELESSANPLPYVQAFRLGADTSSESDIAPANVMRAYDEFRSAEDIDISLIICGKSIGGSWGEAVANYVIDNVVEFRKDCVAFLSPSRDDVITNQPGIEDNVVRFRNDVRSTSYAVMDSGYKYMYDKYNDLFRWIPINGDIAGLAARTDDVRDAWWSPAGFNRGQIRNVARLAWNPSQGQRDILYKNGINPIVTFPGQGTIMFGDKTLLSKPSAFDRINVRRLFIVLEKAIATASKFTLFEFNDEFTRASFVNLVTPFLRDVQGRRGIFDFLVVCDETNNTGEVIDRNEFVGDIYIKPARSINFIQLNFVAVRTGVEFSEIIGNF